MRLRRALGRERCGCHWSEEKKKKQKKCYMLFSCRQEHEALRVVVMRKSKVDQITSLSPLAGWFLR